MGISGLVAGIDFVSWLQMIDLGGENHPGFGFEWPWMLCLIIIIPIFYSFYKNSNRNNEEKGAKFSRISLLQKAAKPGSDHKKILIKIIFLFSVITGVMALAKPVITAEVPTNPVKLMIVFDTSISMEATDMEPNRLEVAKNTAIDFIKKIPDEIRIGLEYFYGSAYVAVNPTIDKEKIINSLEELELKDLYPGTAIGSALDAAINVLTFDRYKNDKPVIILLTDGENNQGYLPFEAAKAAAMDGIKIFTVGIGSPEGAIVRGRYLTTLDEGSLIEIANLSNGEYFRAESEEDFKKIFKELRSKALSLEKKKIEATIFFSGLSFLGFLITSCLGISVYRPVF